jgi:hypothetical protein
VKVGVVSYVGLVINRLTASMSEPGAFLGASLVRADPKDANGKALGYFRDTRAQRARTRRRIISCAKKDSASPSACR